MSGGRADRGVGIEAIPLLPTLRSNIVEAVEDCTADEELIGRGPVYIVGSFARGTALPGESDLDLVVTFIPDESVDVLTPKFDAAKVRVSGCLASKPDSEFFLPEHERVVDGRDLIEVTPQSLPNALEGFLRETRDRRVLGDPKVYSLTEYEYLDRSDIEAIESGEVLDRDFRGI